MLFSPYLNTEGISQEQFVHNIVLVGYVYHLANVLTCAVYALSEQDMNHCALSNCEKMLMHLNLLCMLVHVLHV